MRVRGLLVLVACWVIFAAYVGLTAGQLPENVATHFGANGQANGWMTRSTHVRFTVLMGIGASAFVLGVFSLIRYCGDRGLNIPHKAYWLAPERREATYAFIQLQGSWFAGMLVAFIAAVHHSILVANTRSPVALPMAEAVWLSGGFLVVSLFWVAVFVGRFYRQAS